MILRDYQLTLVERAHVAHMFAYHAPMIVLSTGGGKTVVFSQVTLDAIAMGQVVWIIAHRQELIAQASRTLTGFGIKHGIIRAGEPQQLHLPVQVGSVQTVVRRLDKLPPPDLIIVDECQHSTAATYKKIFAAFPKSSRLGVTATPCRLNGAGLGEVFDHMILGPTTQWLTDQGYLKKVKYYAPPQKADTSNLPMSMGDYRVKDMSEVMDDDVVTGDAVSHYQRICDGVPMLTFCVDVQHAHNVAAEYVAAGYRAAAVDGKISDDERKDRLDGLGNGKYQVITSCELIGEGLDVPVVSAVQLLRPTESLGLYLQQVGRGLRPVEGVEYLTVLDHVGNVRKHGFATTDRQWSLKGKLKRDTAPATRTCEECYSVHRTAKVCPYCGYEYPVKPRELKSKKFVDGQLVEIIQTAEERAEEVKNAKSFSELVAIGKSRGYKRAAFWAKKVFNGRSYVHLMPKV
jgi:superfamily II DNA or RNA helicase